MYNNYLNHIMMKIITTNNIISNYNIKKKKNVNIIKNKV